MTADRRIDLKMGFRCNNRCIFCVQGDKRHEYGDKDVAELRRLLEDAAQRCDSIVFTGGEVTIRPELPALVAYARDLGFRGIQIQTNGRMLAYRGLCQKLIDAGATEFSPALHGHNAELHDSQTRAPGSFEQTTRGIRELKRLGAYVLTNTVITRANAPFLPAIARLLVELGVDQFQLAFVHALGAAEQRFDEVVPRKRDIEASVKQALDIGLRWGKRVMTEAIPFCFMRGYEACVAERVIPRTRIYDATTVLEDYTDYRLAEGKKKGEPCERCAAAPHCEGPWREYPKHFGWDEFVPLSDHEARAVTALFEAARAGGERP